MTIANYLITGQYVGSMVFLINTHYNYLMIITKHKINDYDDDIIIIMVIPYFLKFSFINNSFFKFSCCFNFGRA